MAPVAQNPSFQCLVFHILFQVQNCFHLVLSALDHIKTDLVQSEKFNTYNAIKFMCSEPAMAIFLVKYARCFDVVLICSEYFLLLLV